MRLKSIAENVADFIAISLLFLLTANSLIANWDWSPYWDFFFARVRGPVFYNVHAVSVLSVCFICFWLILRNDFGTPYRWVFVLFATASIHELSLFIADIALRDFQGIANIGVSFSYFAWLAAFLLLGVGLGNGYQRRVLFLTLLFCFVVYAFDIAFNVGTSLVGLTAGPQFLNPFTNAVEVLSWVIPALFWLIPQRFVMRVKL